MRSDYEKHGEEIIGRDRIDNIDYNYYYRNIAPTEDEKNGCIYLTAKGNSTE